MVQQRYIEEKDLGVEALINNHWIGNSQNLGVQKLGLGVLTHFETLQVRKSSVLGGGIGARTI